MQVNLYNVCHFFHDNEEPVMWLSECLTGTRNDTLLYLTESIQ